MKTRSIKLDTIPAWAIDVSAEPSRYAIASAFQLAGLFDRPCRLTADTQRKVFGFNLAGKCQVRVSYDGISLSRKVCFGTDFSDCTLPWNRVEELMHAKQRPVF